MADLQMVKLQTQKAVLLGVENRVFPAITEKILKLAQFIRAC